MKTKKIILGTLLLTATFALSACGNSKQSEVAKIKKQGTITLAVAPDYPPFEYKTVVNGKDTVVGSDIQLAQAIAKKLHVKLKVEAMDFDNVLTSVSNNKADIAISGITYTKLRAKSYDFSNIYYNSPNSIIIKKSNLDKYKSFADFAGKDVSAQKGSTQEQIVQKDMEKSTEVPLAAIGDEVNEIKAGKVEGGVVETLIAKSYVSENPDLALAKVKVPLLAKMTGYAVAMPKGATDLQKQINQVINQMKKDGSMNKNIENSYIAAQKAK